MKRKMIALFTTAALLTGSLIGCGKAQESANTGAGTGQEQAVTGESGEKGITTESVIAKGPVKLRFIFLGDMTSRRDEFFKKEFHDKVMEELNIDLTVEAIPFSNMTQLGTMLASGESFACYNIISNNDYAAKDYLAPIDQELIDALLPDFNRIRNNNGFECVKYNGDIYAIPFGCKPYSGMYSNLDVRDDILQKYGYSADEINTYDELMTMLADIHAKEPELRISRQYTHLLRTFQPEINKNGECYTMANLEGLLMVNEHEDNDKVYGVFDSDLFKTYCKDYAMEWYKLGYLSQEELTNPSSGQAEWEAGNCLMQFGSPGCYISNMLKATDPNAVENMIILDGFEKYATYDYDWGISIAASDEENVDRWLTLFNWMYANQENYDFCAYGVEGKDWERNEDGTIHKLVSDYFIDEWFLQCFEYNTYDASIPQENIDKYVHWDDDAKLSKLAGFTFDSTPVASEYASIKSVVDEKFKPLMLGAVDFDSNYDAALQDLYDAGYEAYVAEFQRQFSEWYAKKQ